MTTSRRKSASGLAAGILVALAGFMAFNLFDTVFGVPKAIVGLVAWTALTLVVFRRSPAAEEKPDA